MKELIHLLKLAVECDDERRHPPASWYDDVRAALAEYEQPVSPLSSNCEINHPAEILKVGDGMFSVFDRSGSIIAHTTSQPYARRVAAVLNACAGISTERLEDEVKDSIWS